MYYNVYRGLNANNEVLGYCADPVDALREWDVVKKLRVWCPNEPVVDKHGKKYAVSEIQPRGDIPDLEAIPSPQGEPGIALKRILVRFRKRGGK